MAWAMSTTCVVVSTLYSKEDGVLASSISEPSIITLEKPERIDWMQIGRAGAVVLVHDDRDIRIGLDGGLDQVAQVGLRRHICGRRPSPA